MSYNRRGPRSWSTWLLPLTVLLSLTVGGSFFFLSGKAGGRLEVLFPLVYLTHSDRIIDPSDLKTDVEYYLLENLAVGLLRDSMDGSSGYGPALATAWRQASERRWEFDLRKDNRWSDGKPILGTE